MRYTWVRPGRLKTCAGNTEKAGKPSSKHAQPILEAPPRSISRFLVLHVCTCKDVAAAACPYAQYVFHCLWYLFARLHYPGQGRLCTHMCGVMNAITDTMSADLILMVRAGEHGLRFFGGSFDTLLSRRAAVRTTIITKCA